MTRAQRTGHLLAASAIAAATMWVALAAWSPFVAVPGDYLGPLALTAAALALTGGLLRAVGSPAPVTLVAQVVVLAAAMSRATTGSYLPDGENLAAVRASLDLALESARNYAAPIGPEAPPVAPLLILGGGILLVLMDLLACGLRRVPLSALALLAVYAVPAGVPTEGSAWFSFLVASIGFLALLHLDARDRMQQWGRAVGPHDSARELEVNPLGEALRAGAGRIGAVAVAAALASPLVIPVLDLGLLEGSGGGGGEDIRIKRPVTDMRRDLQRAADRPLVTVRTDDPRPAYLRIAVLHRFTGQEWSSGDRDVNSSNRADGALPAPIGLEADVPKRTYDYEVAADEDFESTWLPTQFPASRVEAEGDWRFDPDSMDFLASEDQTTAGLRYSMTAIEHDYGNDGSFFRDATPGDVDDEFLELPAGVPDTIGTWAERITQGASDDYARATRLQRWFRDEFTYSLDQAPPGTGNETLEGFLSPEGRVGYCEQFASAMAVMARELGIPARVAVGFLRPERTGSDTWTYSSHDLHAWPELYFSGTGWVRFEPTPGSRATEVPSYSTPQGGTDDVGGQFGGPTEEPTTTDADDGPAPTAAPTDPGPTGGAAVATDEEGWGAAPWVALGTGGIALALTAAVGPGWVRRRQRDHRLAGDAESAWDELWATSVDLGLDWPDQRSPREIGSALEPVVDDADARDALARLVDAVERTRYARPEVARDHVAEVTDDVVACAGALAASVAPRRRRRARWFPASLLRRPPRGGALRDREPVPLG
ncbi:DUF3488 and transglutaminase-like domain-containing protein [Nocardioides panacisoli]|uniref:transglutaminase family protein n=1 Tax=Nocardioides panacisoli TaxID=627624 RepID=UPI001C6264EF|nr:DUF3488 and transglutaminase-like domain-containing protein [Nocardioides panacisoli]QYJ04730.1 DUF3488 and transglutaminase-like domain-containing protein [Nocardioides panacisoli]